MRLREYMDQKGYTVTDFARIIDYSRMSVSRILGGIVNPGSKFKRRVEEKTKGHVKWEDWNNQNGIDKKDAIE